MPKAQTQILLPSYSLSSHVLMNQADVLNPQFSGVTLCTAMVYLDPWLPYWIQVPCQDTTVTKFSICKVPLALSTKEKSFKMTRFTSKSCGNKYSYQNYGGVCYSLLSVDVFHKHVYGMCQNAGLDDVCIPPQQAKLVEIRCNTRV